tara:strand:+ start:416 stop:1138 length:723 start_codon:yes stop_codon:yes gene_type:complete
MGNRRLGAKRLSALEKRGETGLDTLHQAGEGAKNMIVSHRMFREGNIITTEIHVDLQGRPGSGHVFFGPDDNDAVIGATTYVPVATDDAATQEVNAKAAAVEGAHLMVWQNEIHGRIFEADVIVLEAPNEHGAGTQGDIDIKFADFESTDKYCSGNPSNIQLTLVAHGGVLAEGERFSLPLGDDAEGGSALAGETDPITPLADVNDDALYLTARHDNPGIQYTQGQFLITLRGYDTTVGF